ncbi:MAG: 4-(cytidine 5'-diphospho)-2-C-methyl-D-erythritol kinase [Rhodospirillales bacterium]|nr:4-(cytidine 5'-diphospho)-2-C-methyl-D-erythritol kinase [Rhodospirillales bacterium]MSP80910.1 4-(cytidine 5'-diphospho)-2-C-methyl-D-erythritol kinase [Rhodospirillales bacterium]
MARPPAAAADSPVRVAAPAKVNLYLHVVGRRPDGYHLLDSLVAFAGIGDTLEVRAAPDISLAIEGPFANRIPKGEDNLVLRAARALAQATGAGGAAIRLVKRLPPAAGIGGGSADAAATLRALIRLWDARLDPRALARLALGLGADVPVCLAGQTAFVGGIGEDLAFAPALPSAAIVLANPGTPVPTAEVFRRRAGAFSEPARFSETPRTAAELAALLATRGNDLEEPARAICPAIGDALTALARQPGALIARMSGSGGTCFALFGQPGAATEAAFAINRAQPTWWVEAGSLESDAARLENGTAPGDGAIHRPPTGGGAVH